MAGKERYKNSDEMVNRHTNRQDDRTMQSNAMETRTYEMGKESNE